MACLRAAFSPCKLAPWAELSSVMGAPSPVARLALSINESSRRAGGIDAMLLAHKWLGRGGVVIGSCEVKGVRLLLVCMMEQCGAPCGLFRAHI